MHWSSCVVYSVVRSLWRKERLSRCDFFKKASIYGKASPFYFHQSAKYIKSKMPSSFTQTSSPCSTFNTSLTCAAELDWVEAAAGCYFELVIDWVWAFLEEPDSRGARACLPVVWYFSLSWEPFILVLSSMNSLTRAAREGAYGHIVDIIFEYNRMSTFSCTIDTSNAPILGMMS